MWWCGCWKRVTGWWCWPPAGSGCRSRRSASCRPSASAFRQPASRYLPGSATPLRSEARPARHAQVVARRTPASPCGDHRDDQEHRPGDDARQATRGAGADGRAVVPGRRRRPGRHRALGRDRPAAAGGRSPQDAAGDIRADITLLAAGQQHGLGPLGGHRAARSLRFQVTPICQAPRTTRAVGAGLFPALRHARS
jgi:hypothetical protein